MLGRPAIITVIILKSTFVDMPVAIAGCLSRESRVESREPRGEKASVRVRMVATAPADRVKQHGHKRQPLDRAPHGRVELEYS